MHVSVLIDNITRNSLLCEWGLAIYIEFDGKKYLLDTGASDSFIKNANDLGIDLKEVDYGILSHAHDDHSDGMDAFFNLNEKAKFYLRKACKEDCYGTKLIFPRYIGIKRYMIDNHPGRVEYVDRDYAINEKVKLIPHKKVNLELIGKQNRMYVKKDGKLVYDSFRHEQSLVFDTDKGLVIFNSCCHAGAYNIIDEIRSTYPGRNIYAIIGGFHLFQMKEKQVLEFAQKLKETGVKKIYTGHCTGDKGFEILKEQLGDIVNQFYSGLEFDL